MSTPTNLAITAFPGQYGSSFELRPLPDFNIGRIPSFTIPVPHEELGSFASDRDVSISSNNLNLEQFFAKIPWVALTPHPRKAFSLAISQPIPRNRSSSL